MVRIATRHGHYRMSTQDLLLQISEAVANGETDFYIAASGQHDIGGPLWNPSGKDLHFHVTNPGQRVGAMCLPGTFVQVDGPAPADVGWLNSGGIITIKGDAGDTAGHCAAAGRIYIGGRAGTRSGSLMKHDPELEQPELWVLNSVGSFSFEFMSGGTAVICGHDSQLLPSVLGHRPCVGMVGGTVYFRGPCGELPADVAHSPLTPEDITWLESGLDAFLEHIGQQKLKRELSVWRHWHKLIPVSCGQTALPTLEQFRRAEWVPGGIFGSIYPDEQHVTSLVPVGAERLNIPEWQNEEQRCTDCRHCLEGCPRGAVKRREKDGVIHYDANGKRCIGCGICSAVCPQAVWQMVL